MESVVSSGELTLSSKSGSTELEATVDGAQPKLSRRKQRLAKLSVKQLTRRSWANTIAAFATMIGGIPTALLLSSVSLEIASPFVGLGMILGGGLWGIFGNPHSDEILKRERQDRTLSKIRWQEKAIDDLETRFNLRLTPQELEGLDYPEEHPTDESMIHYGTIKKLLKDEEANIRLERITLIWDESEFKLLRSVSDLRELNRGAMA